MVTRNVHAQTEFCLALLGELFTDLREWFPDYSNALSVDLATISKRARQEGFSFLSKTLPLLGKAIEHGLENGSFVAPREFKLHGKTQLTSFLRCLLSDLFDERGMVHADSRPRSLSALRQVVYIAYRLELAYQSSDSKAVVDRFVETERELGTNRQKPWYPVTYVSKILAESILDGFDPVNLVCRHGPGAVATGEIGDEKFTFRRHYSRIHQLYPYYDYYIVGGAKELIDRIQWYRSLERLEVGQAKVILVPKDSRGPRLISEEPLEYQWIQQGLGRKLMRHLEAKTQGHIMFTDQSINGELARVNSITREMATIDMKDASDRISCALVSTLIPERFYKYFYAARTSSTRLPDGRLVELQKFAPMGSALCFPIEAFCFYVLAVSAIHVELGVNLQTARSMVQVYGDDIIIPVNAYHAVTSAYESWLLIVNHDKSFLKGFFRESCGIDAFKGVDVTPVKPRTLWSGRREDGSALCSWVSYGNGFSRRGYSNTASFIKRIVEQTYGKIPYGLPSSGGVCWECDSYFEACRLNVANGIKIRTHPSYQRAEVYSYTSIGQYEPTTLDGWHRLLRNLCCGSGDEPNLTALRRAKIRKRWFPI